MCTEEEFNFLKIYVDGSDKIKKNNIPYSKKISINLFIGSLFSNLFVYVIENINLDKSLELCLNICENRKIREDATNEEFFKKRTKINGDLVAIYAKKKTCLNIMGIDNSRPLIDSIRNFEINENSLLFFPNVLKKSLVSDEKCLLYCFGKKGADIFKENYEKIQKNIPMVITCYDKNLKNLGFNSIQNWIDSNPEKNLYIGRRPPTFETGENGKKTRTKLKTEISPLAVSKALKAIKNENQDYFEICYSKYLDFLFEKGDISLDYLSGKTLGCWCKKDERCNCSIIIEKFKEKTFRNLIE